MILLIAGTIGVAVVTLWKAHDAWEEDRLSLMWGWLISGLVICTVLGLAIWLALGQAVIRP